MRTWNVNLSNKSNPCECGVPKRDMFPCKHVVYACEKGGVEVTDLLHEHDTTKHWKAQYANLPAFNVPGSMAIENVEKDDNVLLAPKAIPAQRGRPSTKRKDNAHNIAAAEAEKRAKFNANHKSKRQRR